MISNDLCIHSIKFNYFLTLSHITKDIYDDKITFMCYCTPIGKWCLKIFDSFGCIKRIDFRKLERAE